MVDLDIINGTIAEWEAKDLTFLVVERLAWLYIVRDNAVMRLKEGQRFGVYRYACDRVIVGQ